MTYERLLEPGQIGRMKLRNRIVMSPTETHFTASDGMLTWPEVDYYGLELMLALFTRTSF